MPQDQRGFVRGTQRCADRRRVRYLFRTQPTCMLQSPTPLYFQPDPAESAIALIALRARRIAMLYLSTTEGCALPAVHAHTHIQHNHGSLWMRRD